MIKSLNVFGKHDSETTENEHVSHAYEENLEETSLYGTEEYDSLVVLHAFPDALSYLETDCLSC